MVLQIAISCEFFLIKQLGKNKLYINKRTNKWTEGWMLGWMYGRMDGRTMFK